MLDALLVTGSKFLSTLLTMALLFAAVSVVVGALKEYLSEDAIKRFLSGRGGRGNLIAAALGALTPFCTVTTLPVVLQLKDTGAPFGAIMSFFLASPLINPVVLVLFLAMFGWQITLAYTSICLTAAIGLGAVGEWLRLDRDLRHNARFAPSACAAGCASAPRGTAHRLGRVFRGAGRQFRGVVPYLFLGAGIAALVYGIIPEAWIARVAGPDTPWAIPAAALGGTALYIGIESMLPVGLALLESGMGFGAVMALIVSAAGVSLPEIVVLSTVFKPRLLVAYVGAILGLAVGTGFLLSLLFG